MPSPKELGQQGEKLVQEYLIRREFEIISTNYHAKGGEIDIIAKQKKQLRFVEVKSRSHHNSSVGEAAEAIHLLKHTRLEKAMYAFLEEYSEPYEDYCLDVAVVEFSQNKARIIYYPNALEAHHDI